MLADWSTGGGCAPSPQALVLQSVCMSAGQAERERATIRKGSRATIHVWSLRRRLEIITKEEWR